MSSKAVSSTGIAGVRIRTETSWASAGDRAGALHCERTVSTLQSYRKSSRHLAPFIHKFVHFTHKYVTCNAPAAVAFLQKHADAL